MTRAGEKANGVGGLRGIVCAHSRGLGVLGCVELCVPVETILLGGGVVAITIIVGPPGAGKSVELVAQAFDALAEGRPVFSNFPIVGCYRLLEKDLACKLFPRKSVLLVDEAGSSFDARSWPLFALNQRLFFRQHRKLGMNLYMAAQHPAMVDVEIRRIVNEWWVAEPGLFWFRYSCFYQWREADWESGSSHEPNYLRVRFKRRALFQAYDTNYLHDMVDRVEMELVPWPIPAGYDDRTWVQRQIDILKARMVEGR